MGLNPSLLALLLPYVVSLHSPRTEHNRELQAERTLDKQSIDNYSKLSRRHISLCERKWAPKNRLRRSRSREPKGGKKKRKVDHVFQSDFDRDVASLLRKRSIAINRLAVKRASSADGIKKAYADFLRLAKRSDSSLNDSLKESTSLHSAAERFLKGLRSGKDLLDFLIKQDKRVERDVRRGTDEVKLAIDRIDALEAKADETSRRIRRAEKLAEAAIKDKAELSKIKAKEAAMHELVNESFKVLAFEVDNDERKITSDERLKVVTQPQMAEIADRSGTLEGALARHKHGQKHKRLRRQLIPLLHEHRGEKRGKERGTDTRRRKMHNRRKLRKKANVHSKGKVDYKKKDKMKKREAAAMSQIKKILALKADSERDYIVNDHISAR
eukprot:TRINITY_DN43196_c0_g1_i1.p1 TRINITY_DN43196_c0_g1~~TRINITY_DN43196_c0_g1_i1.p1  ORF type:complete len:385 (-),score=57.11 TRINITY_DN43196_c0_g1_i1:41-1195(-)